MSISMKSLKTEILSNYQELDANYQKLDANHQELVADYQELDANYQKLDDSHREAQDEVRRLKARILELEAADFVHGNPEGPTNQAQAWARRLGPGSYVVGYDLNSGERRFWVKRAPRTPNLVGQRLSAEALEEALT